MQRALAAVVCLLVVATTVPLASRAAPQGPEWVEASWQIDFASLLDADVSGTIEVHKGQFSGTTKTADDLRSDHDQARTAGQGDAFIAQAESTVASNVRSNLEKLYPDADVTNVSADLDERTLEDAPGTDAFHPTIDFNVSAKLDFSLAAYTAGSAVDEQMLRDALAMGAVLDHDLDFRARPGHNATYQVTLPPEVRRVNGSDPVTVTLTNWQGRNAATRTVPLRLTGAQATVHDAQRGGARVVVDIADVETGPLPTGSATLRIEIGVTASIAAAPVPDDFEAQLPDTVDLDFVPADGLRLALDRGYLTRDDLRAALEEFGRTVNQSLRSAFGPDVQPEVGFAEGTLERSYDPQRLRADTPVRAVATAEASREIPLLGGGGQAAIVLTSFPTAFDVVGFPGWETTYEVVLPAGLTFSDAGVLDPSATTDISTREGREVLTARLPAEEETSTSELSMTIGVTPGFVAAEFPLLVLALVLLVVLAVGGAAWALAGGRRRRRSRRGFQRVDDRSPERGRPPGDRRQGGGSSGGGRGEAPGDRDDTKPK